MAAATMSSPAQRLALSLLNAWSNGDQAAIASTLESAAAPRYEDGDDVLELVVAIGAKLRGNSTPEDVRASVKLLSHLARPRF